MPNPTIRSLIIKIWSNNTNFPSEQAEDCGVRSIELAKGGVTIPLEEVILGEFASEAAAPADSFAAAVEIFRDTRYSSNNIGATAEAGEDSLGYGENSVWFRWTADATEQITVSLFGSDFDTALFVYTGTDVSSLTLIADNDDFDFDGDGIYESQSRVDFPASTGVEYKICVRGYDSGSEGNIKLALHRAVSGSEILCYSSIPENTDNPSCNLSIGNCFRYKGKNGSSCGTSFLSTTGLFSGVTGTAIGGGYRQLVAVYPRLIEIDSVVINNYHYGGITTEKGLGNIEIFASESQVAQIDAEQHLVPISGEFTITSGTVFIPEHNATAEADDFVVNVSIDSQIDAFGALAIGCQMEGDSVVQKAMIGTAFLLSSKISAGRDSSGEVVCGLELAASALAGPVYSPAALHSCFELTCAIESEAEKAGDVRGNICVACLMSGAKVPQATLRSALELAVISAADMVPQGAVNCGFSLGMSAASVGGSGKLCSLKEFDKGGFF